MPMKLSTMIAKIENIPNPMNVQIVNEFLDYMSRNGSSEHHQNNNLKVVIAFANFLDKNSFYQVNTKQQVLDFLDTKVRTSNEDPDKKWITTWNNYLNRMRLFYRWLFNHGKETETENWQTPEFFKIKTKKSKRVSPYLETEIWERDELLRILKYEPHRRNKAALTLFWDLNGRNHEITLLKIKHLKIKENYGEGEVPHESKTGGGPVLLTTSFVYVRDWINEHPFKNMSHALLESIVLGIAFVTISVIVASKIKDKKITDIMLKGSVIIGPILLLFITIFWYICWDDFVALL